MGCNRRPARPWQLMSENERLAELNSKFDAIMFSSATNSSPANPTPDESEM